MRWPFQRHSARRDTSDPDAIAAAKRRLELTDLQLGVRERTLKVDAIQRVAESEPDPVTALEVISIATHRGRLPPSVYTRRKPDQSPLEALAMAMLQKRIEEDPGEALEKYIERRERLEEAADRLIGGGRQRDDGDTGNTFVDVARALANSPLGEAVGNVLGAQAQQRMSEAAATAGRVSVTPQPPAVPSPSAGELEAAPTADSGPRPSSFRAGMALRVLKALNAADRARWILSQSDQHPELGELVEPFLAADPPAVPIILEAFLNEAATGGDPAVLEWVPLVEYFRENLDWTLETHAEMRALALESVGDDDELAAHA